MDGFDIDTQRQDPGAWWGRRLGWGHGLLVGSVAAGVAITAIAALDGFHATGPLAAILSFGRHG